uniref:uncharacterized protein LOC131128399 isoform X2 n=1 Tax=Doryrhamphus excisus TaxID=161450 RepID=UPI0025AEA24C|nr:uncharacterized protein LOC131128399 isoform X2 [Doryrhamphus excisus]
MAKGKNKPSGDRDRARKRQAISMETKVAIIRKLDRGEKVANVARSYNMNHSTIWTIYKNKDRIMEHIKSSVLMQSTVITKQRGKLMEEMEQLLSNWIEHQSQREAPLSLMLIQEKARSLLKDLKMKAGEDADDDTFAASSGWFHRFKKRANLQVSGSALTRLRFSSPPSPQDELLEGQESSQDRKHSVGNDEEASSTDDGPKPLLGEALPGGPHIEKVKSPNSSFMSVPCHPVLFLPMTKTEPDSFSGDETDVSDVQLERVRSSGFQAVAPSCVSPERGPEAEDLRALYCSYLRKEIENRDQEMAYRALKMKKLEKEIALLDKELM